MEKVYLITVNSSYPFDAVKFHNFITTTLYPKYVSNWWHYLPGNTYFVVSTLNANQLYNLIYPSIPLRHVMVMEVNPKNQQGWLVKEAWDWFKKFR